jgi:CheY-like chemotaxis protein/anti-sigma regulatory factor (Ser/Thr protein kinase)
MSSNKPKLLVVDDEELNRQIILKYLEDENYEIDCAEDGEKALEYLENTPSEYDLVLLDRMMPKMNGIEVLHKMKQDARLNDIPVILQTARATKDDILEGIKTGAYFYLTKPFEEEMLLSMVHSAINDRLNYLALQDALDLGSQSLSMMTNGEFKIYDLEEANNLSTFLAKTCPNPQKVVTGLSELFINAIEHGNLGITYDEKTDLINDGTWYQEIIKRLNKTENKDKFVTVLFVNDDDSIRITITDEGNGFNWKDYLEINPERIYDNHGRGIATSKIISFDDMQYSDKGNEVTVTVLLNTKAESKRAA